MLPFKEENVVRKDWRKVDLKIALCYPNVYRAGMSGLTVQLLYALLNSREDVVCERFFLPTKNEPLLSVESNQPLNKFDVVAFTFQYEEDYVNALRMLIDSKIEVWVEKRRAKPILVAGGPCIFENPTPLRQFIDLFVVGEIEPLLDEFVDGLKESVKEKTVENFREKDGYLTPTSNLTRKVYIKDLDEAPHPIAQVIPNVDSNSSYLPVFGRTFTVEVMRGCPGRCRFCLISHVNKPMRKRSVKKLEEIIGEGLKYTKVSKVTLIGAGVAYYPKLEDICEYITGLGLKISVSSLAANLVTEKLVECLVKGGQRTITLAPETGSDEFRRKVVGKPLTNEQILDASKVALKKGIRNIKLYFVIGFPGEKEEDIESIVELSRKIAELGFGPKSVRLSINPLIPKPHTPFQFCKIMPIDYLKKAYMKVKNKLRDKRIEVEGFNPKHAYIQTALSMGNQKLGEIIFKVAKYGGNLGSWRRVLKKEKISLESLLQPPRLDEEPVWSIVDVGVDDKLLAEEYLRVLK